MANLPVRTMRIELSVCLLAPVFVLALIAITGYGHIARLKREVAAQITSLAEIPLLETRLADAAKALDPYRLKNGGRDRNGELSLYVSQSGALHGMTVKSVIADKMVPVSPAFMENRIVMGGEGTLGPLIRMLEDLNQPDRCFKVASLRIRARTFTPQTVYDVESVFVADFLGSSGADGTPLSGNLEANLGRLCDGTQAVLAKSKAPKAMLDTHKIDSRKMVAGEKVVPLAVPDETVGFKLQGIIRDGRAPLALTDRGVFGVGDYIDGYRVTKVADEYILVVGRQGRQERVPLYKAEVSP